MPMEPPTGWTSRRNDQHAAKSFYGALFGWSSTISRCRRGPPYSMALKDGSVVAAIAPQSPDMAAQGAPPMWNTYIAVDDVDAADERAKAAGGQVLMEPFDVMDAGRMSFVMDPTGADGRPLAGEQAHRRQRS